MGAKALLNANPQPTAEEARAAMTGNICRCSGYNHYVAAVVAAGNAASVARGFEPGGRGLEKAAPHVSSIRSEFFSTDSGVSAMTVVGQSTPRIDAVERVTGKAT